MIFPVYKLTCTKTILKLFQINIPLTLYDYNTTIIIVDKYFYEIVIKIIRNIIKKQPNIFDVHT